MIKTLWRWVRWPLIILAVAYVALVLYRIPAVGQQQRTAEAIKNIQSAKITEATVMGTNLPPQPYKPENEATVAGLDKNGNGIRDDVELAIFAKYPKEAKIRAGELQFALAQQLMITEVFNADTWKAAANQYTRADDCMSDQKRLKEVEDLVLNTQERKQANDAAFKFTTSVGLPNMDLCDVDLASLPN